MLSGADRSCAPYTGGSVALYDRRRQPSRRQAPAAEVRRILRLYRDHYQGFNVRHFHHLARRDHAVTLSYSFVRLALQEAGLVPKRRARGRHRRRREPRPRFGELLHLDGSAHAWLALCPDQRQVLLAVLDDATKRLLYAQLWPAETTRAVLTALREVVQAHGLPAALYTDRAGWAFHTPKAGGPVDREHLTHVGQALARLGIEHIGAYSPQARGRGERLNRTLQDRLVNELRRAGITTVAAANAYLRNHFIPDYNATFTRPPADPTSAFVPLGDVDLDQFLCEQEARVVSQDNIVSFDGVQLQLAKQPGRPTCAGLRVVVRRHLDGRYTVWRGPHCLGRYTPHGATAPRRLEQGPARFRSVAADGPPLRRRHRPRPPVRPRRLGPRLPVGAGG
ncbi:MAG TPA: ISNCY family transposase [Candidatus Binatia bacterium]|nr:ISNCY family transposase [Candidatus Binatia bacterium]